MVHMLLSILICFAAPKQLIAMEKEGNQPTGFITSLPQEINIEILKAIVETSPYAEISKFLQRLALSNKNNKAFIENEKTTEQLIQILSNRTKNKVRAAEILKTTSAKRWLDSYIKTAEGAQELKQAHDDETKFVEIAHLHKQNPEEELKNAEEFKKYIALGVNINTLDGFDWTALRAAIREGHTELAKILLSTPGILVNEIDPWDRISVLEWAIMNKQFEIVKLLLSKPEIEVNYVDKASRTALDKALYIKTNDKTAVGIDEIVTLLKKAGAKTGQELSKTATRLPKK